MDLIDDPAPGGNAHEFTVSELSGAVKRVIEGEFGRVRVKGEVGRVVRARSGHLYFDLKDDRAVIAAVSWKGQAARLAILPEEGMEVVAMGRMTTFPGQSKYQLIVDDVRPAGLGALMAMLEKRKKALEAEGLFDPARKRPLPFLPEVIGVITSPQGAVIRDILHRLRDRFPRKVLVWPVAVQGERCAPEVVRAIEGFNAFTSGGALPRPDVLIVARGGGSIEDLWGFNEEAVARAAAASDIPLISAVGHETDTTLIDYVSDRRAPTPTAAAEMAVPVRMELLASVEGSGARMRALMAERITTRRQRLADLSRGLPRPEALLDQPRQRIDQSETALRSALRHLAAGKRQRLTEVAGRFGPGLLGARIDARKDTLQRQADRLGPALARRVADAGRVLAQAARGFDRAGGVMARNRDERRQRLGDGWARAALAITRMQTAQAERLAALERLRQSLGYRRTLERGYAVVRSGDSLITTASAARTAPVLEIEFRDGRMTPGGSRRGGGSGGGGGPDQGELF